MDYAAGNAQLRAGNKQRLRDLYEGVVAGKSSDMATLFAPEVVVYEPAMIPYGGVYIGFDGQKKLA